MNTNESPYEVPDELKREVLAELDAASFNRYPEHDAAEFLGALAEHVGRSTEELTVANGSNEALMQLFLAFGGPGRTSLTFEPTYSLHTSIARIAGTATAPVGRGERFRVDVDDALNAVESSGADIVMLCSPNNPSGNLDPHDTVVAIADAAPGLVVVDEAYIDFADDDASVLPLLDDHPNLVIVRTFSKAWGLAGARLGYVIAHPDVIAGLAKVRLPYHLSSPSQLLGLAALRHHDAVMDAVEKTKRERQSLHEALRAMGVTVHPSEANFILFEVEDAASAWQAFLDRGVLVRSYAERRGLERCLRVTVGAPEENGAFMNAAEEVLGAAAAV